MRLSDLSAREREGESIYRKIRLFIKQDIFIKCTNKYKRKDNPNSTLFLNELFQNLHLREIILKIRENRHLSSEHTDAREGRSCYL